MISPVLIYDTSEVPSSEEESPLNTIVHVDLPWLTVLTLTYEAGDKIVIHANMDVVEADDFITANAHVPPYSLMLPMRTDTRTLPDCENEAMISYWSSY